MRRGVESKGTSGGRSRQSGGINRYHTEHFELRRTYLRENPLFVGSVNDEPAYIWIIANPYNWSLIVMR